MTTHNCKSNQNNLSNDSSQKIVNYVPVERPFFDKDQEIQFPNLNMKDLYLKKEEIHKILYDKEKVISIRRIPDIKMEDLFYLTLLINENLVLINYVYPLEYIKIINNYLKDEKQIIIKIVYCKIIFVLIRNYKDIKEEEEKEELNKIQKDAENIIKDLEEKYNDIIKDIKKKPIDKFYSEIINFIIEYKIDKAENISKIFQDLDLERIDLPEKMIEEITKKLKDNYKLKNIKNLLDNNIVNYYYALLKYVYKNTLFLQIPFFLESRNIIKDFLNSKNKNILQGLSSLDDSYKNKIKFITKKLADIEIFDENRNNNKAKKNNTFDDDYNKKDNSNLSYDNKNDNNMSLLNILNDNNWNFNDNRKTNINITEKKGENSFLNSFNLSIQNKYIEKSENISYLNIGEKSVIKSSQEFPKEDEGPNKIEKIEDYNVFITLKAKFNKNDGFQNDFKYIEIKRVNQKFQISRTNGYKIMMGVIAFIKEDFNENEFPKIAGKIIERLNDNNYDKEECKTILEISTMNNIISLEEYKLFAGKIMYGKENIIFDDENDNNATNNRKNGIFIAFNSNKKIYYFPFKNNLEINYICPIYNVPLNYKKDKKSETNLFLTVGFEEGKQKTRLFRMDININKKFKIVGKDVPLDIIEKIRSIRQLENGEIVISFKNKINLYSRPNL